ncbi:heparan-alpha-glucosaminide N-acetyltransferase domain-containing protein [Melioribacteraceae bacterium 4301-Me]|uniref:heparan-alpha-glucosaminide N-acetyltransferase domain-containing protein n=1 Tax=Pyranulibacter aquaticus TaxID=3163344 RepID=UPI0035997C6F
MRKTNVKRIIFLDLMRALAVLMMVEGHTVDTFLADQFRDYSSVGYNIWLTIRGFTAPIFMFTSGVVFTYLLKLQDLPFKENPRVYKGLKRFVTLVLIGYVLRFPTYKIFDYNEVTKEQWLSFFAVDALHLIGFGLLFIIGLLFIADKLKAKDSYLLLSGACFFFVAYLFVENINWIDFFPAPLAAYFYSKSGSLFPLFPWSGYVITGAILGQYLAKNPDAFTTKSFSMKLSIVGIALLLTSFIFHYIEDLFYGNKQFWTDQFALIFYRLGVVLLLNSAMSFLAAKIKNIPELVKQIGRNTLLIYAVHVVILYGSAWFPGFYKYFARTLSFSESLFAALLMILLMVWMVKLIQRYKDYQKKKLAVAEI